MSNKLRKTIPAEIRLSRKTKKANSKGCMLWTGAKSRKGYGMIQRGRRSEGTVEVHRLAYELAYGKILNNLQVLHSCDVRSCVNPEHLFLGTQLNNLNDMRAKGRGKHKASLGSDHGNAKLTDNDVRYIRYKRAKGVSARKLAKKFHLHEATVRRIVRRTAWKHLA